MSQLVFGSENVMYLTVLLIFHFMWIALYIPRSYWDISC